MTKRMTRRGVLRASAATTALPLVHIRTAGAAGKLTMGLWDHWVAEANPVLRSLVDEWGAKNKVEVQIDFIASTKIPFTQAAEAQARTGHDVLAFDQWAVQLHHEKLIEPPRVCRRPNSLRGWPDGQAREDPTEVFAGGA